MYVHNQEGMIYIWKWLSQEVVSEGMSDNYTCNQEREC